MSGPIGLIYIPPWNSDFAERGMDLYRSCPHKCTYCYVHDWDRRKRWPTYKEGVLDQQLRDMAIEPNAPIRVHLCHFCDPYGGPNNSAETRRVLETFKRYWNPFQILTKAGTKATRDFDLYFEGCRFGCTLTFDNDVDSLKWEPGAALPRDRIEALKQAHDQGINTWAVLEPVIVPSQSINLIEQTHEFVDYYWVGKLNHNPDLEKNVNWAEFLGEAKALLKSRDKDFGVKWQLDRAAKGMPAYNPWRHR
jgi:DNA repair photolyase